MTGARPVSYEAHPCTPQVPVGRWLLVHLRPDLPAERARTIVSAICLHFPDVASAQDLSHCTPEGLEEILAIPDSTIPTRDQLEALQPVRQEELGL